MGTYCEAERARLDARDELEKPKTRPTAAHLGDRSDPHTARGSRWQKTARNCHTTLEIAGTNTAYRGIALPLL